MKISIKILFLLFLGFFISQNQTKAQQTVGVFINDSTGQDGYVLFSPSGSPYTFLIDKCGREINRWNSPYSPGQSLYFLDNGHLLRTARIGNAVFSGGGSGGRIEEYDWNDSLVWSFNYSSNQHQQHHDIFPMPNGNVLVLAREIKTQAEAIAAGRNPVNAPALGLWPETVVELQKVGNDSAIVVWKWNMWDHLVQEFDSTKANFAEVSDHPELLNLNFLGQPNAVPDWCHANAAQYDPVRDEIIISSRQLSELWIIDHSTTTAEAASHAGGNSGKGGDFLYRWGNPRAYQRGIMADQKLFGQHTTHRVPQGFPNEGKILLFNNGVNRPGGNYSTVELIVTPFDSAGNYIQPAVGPFAPDSCDWKYQSPQPSDFYSQFISGAQQLPNGHILICEGDNGHFFEVDSTGNVFWKYINPVVGTTFLNQGDVPANNGVFRATLVPTDHPGLTGKDLTHGDPLELNPVPVPCPALLGTTSRKIWKVTMEVDYAQKEIVIINPEGRNLMLQVSDVLGVSLNEIQSSSLRFSVSFGQLSSALICISVSDAENHQRLTKKILNR